MKRVLQPSKAFSLNLRSFGLLCAGAALCASSMQAQDGQSDLAGMTPSASSPVALVYVSTSGGIRLFSAASNGTLTAVSASPFKVTGQMVGSNGKTLVTTSSTDVYTYKIGPNGAITEEASSLNTKNYGGGQCGNIAGAVLDHTGQDVYVAHVGKLDSEDSNLLCYALQNTGISSSSGSLTYKGDLIVSDDDKNTGSTTLPVFLGNNKFAFSLQVGVDSCEGYIDILSRGSNGDLNLASSQTVNYPKRSGYYYFPMYPSDQNGAPGNIFTTLITDDGSDHVAMAVYAENQNDIPCGKTTTPQLASFTADSHGNLTSTNMAANMPTVSGSINALRMSPSGNLLAIATGTGVQIFHFNGAAPITKFTGVIGTSGFVNELQWDKSNHLYAVNAASGKLHVYTVTTSSVVEAAGSPYSIGATSSPLSLAVVSK